MSNMLTKYELEAQSAAGKFNDITYMRNNFPALFSHEAHPRMSERYAFTHTYDIVTELQSKNYRIVSIQGGDTRFSQMLIRMRHMMYLDTRKPDTDGAPELVIIDSHDGSKSLRLALGYIKFLCMNGCIAGDMLYNKRFRHSSRDLMAQVMLEVADINSYVETLQNNVTEMRHYRTTIGDRIRLADVAVETRFCAFKKDTKPHDETFKLHMRQELLHRRRVADTAEDLHTVVNVIQENAIRGGIQYTTAMHRRLTSKPINDVTRNVAINTALWNEATMIMQQKAA